MSGPRANLEYEHWRTGAGVAYRRHHAHVAGSYVVSAVMRSRTRKANNDADNVGDDASVGKRDVASAAPRTGHGDKPEKTEAIADKPKDKDGKAAESGKGNRVKAQAKDKNKEDTDQGKENMKKSTEETDQGKEDMKKSKEGTDQGKENTRKSKEGTEERDGERKEEKGQKPRRMTSMQGQLRLCDFAGQDLDVDQFVAHALGPRLGAAAGGDVLSLSDAGTFDPEAILEALLATKSEVDRLREDADSRVHAAAERLDALSERHSRSLVSLRQDADHVLRSVHDLQDTVGSMGGKAVTMGRHLDKIEQQRRRACDAAQAIRIYEVLCGDNDDAAVRALKALIPDTVGAAAGRSDKRRSDLMDAALMLRKLQAAAHVATGEGARRVRARLEDAGKAMEHAVVLSFDEATARCDSAAPDSQAYAAALVDMRAAADALLYYNGGATVMQRYVSTRRPFIDADVILADRQAMEAVRSYADALDKVEHLIYDMMLFVQAEARRLPQVFSKHDVVMLMLVERLCYERLAPMVEGVLEQAEAAERCAYAERRALADEGDGSVAAPDPPRSGRESNERLECKVKIVGVCQRLLECLEDPNRHTPAPDGLQVPVPDKDARDDVADIIADILAPYIHNFVEVQVDTLTECLTAYLPIVTPEDLVVYDVRVELQAAAQVDKHFARVPSQDADGVEGRKAAGEKDGNKPTPGGSQTMMAGLGWAAKKRQDSSSNNHMPATPAAGRWFGGKRNSSADASKRPVVIKIANIARAVEETGLAIKRVLAIIQSNSSHSHRPQSALRVVAAYIETYNSFLYACINHAVTVCAQQLQQCAAANDRAAHDLDAPRVAYVAVAGARALHQMLARCGLTRGAGLQQASTSAALSQMLTQSDAWTEGAIDLLSKGLVDSTMQQAAATLNSLRLKRDYTPIQEGERGGEGPKADTVVEMKSTEACRQCVLLVRGVAWSWLQHGPSAMHGEGSCNSEGSIQEGGALGIAAVKLFRRTLDVNSTTVFGELASGLYKLFSKHIIKQSFTAQGAVRLLHDLAALQALGRDLGDAAAGAVQKFETLSQAANILVVNPDNLVDLLDDKSAMFSDEGKVGLQMLRLISCRADWPSLKPKLEERVLVLKAELLQHQSSNKLDAT